MDESGTLTAQEFADAVGYSRLALLRVLQRNLELPETERRLPGAYHTNMSNRRRGEWRIPRLQIVTIEQLLEGVGPRMPSHRPTFKEAPAAPSFTHVQDTELL